MVVLINDEIKNNNNNNNNNINIILEFYYFRMQILAAAVTNLPDEVSMQLPSSDSIRRSLRHVRAKHRPKEPASLDELVISDSWTMISGENPEPFLLYDNGTDANERLLIFSTAEHLQYLGSSRNLFMDGTFGVAPALFSQLYVIHGQVGCGNYPLLYALMQRQTQASYEELFKFITDHCDAEPSTISVDFEKAVHQAIRVVFGEGVRIQGCFYHLTQSTWRKIQALGLTEIYRADDDFKLFCGQLDALAFLPIEKVSEGMTYIKSVMPIEAEELVEYFDSTYVSGSVRRRPIGNQLRLRLRRVNPAFPPSLWNCHEATLNDEHRTNNVCEGWNNGFVNLVGHDHPSIWKLIESLQKESARIHLLAVQDSRGIRPVKRVLSRSHILQKRLKNLCSDYAAERKDIAELLRGVSHNIRFGQPNI